MVEETSMQLPLDENRMKELFKDALGEFFDERRDLLREVVSEVIEDVGLVHAIKEGEAGVTVSRNEIFNLLEGGA